MIDTLSLCYSRQKNSRVQSMEILCPLKEEKNESLGVLTFQNAKLTLSAYASRDLLPVRIILIGPSDHYETGRDQKVDMRERLADSVWRRGEERSERKKGREKECLSFLYSTNVFNSSLTLPILDHFCSSLSHSDSIDAFHSQYPIPSHRILSENYRLRREESVSKQRFIPLSLSPRALPSSSTPSLTLSAAASNPVASFPCLFPFTRPLTSSNTMHVPETSSSHSEGKQCANSFSYCETSTHVRHVFGAYSSQTDSRYRNPHLTIPRQQPSPVSE